MTTVSAPESASSITVTRAEPNIGARVDGIDLSNDMSDEVIATLRALLVDHHVVVLPGQVLSAKELEQFGQMWGELLKHPATQHHDTPYVQFIQGVTSKVEGRFGTWHSDMTWHPTPPIITMLHAQQLPGEGGDTAFANQHLAYETLPTHLREALIGAQAFHSGKVFGPDVPDSVHPAIRTHDESGRKALFLNNAFTRHLVDVEPTLSRALIAEASQHGTRLEFCYRHKWDLHDLVIWDNRSVMHCPAFDYTEPRYMNRIVVKGAAPA